MEVQFQPESSAMVVRNVEADVADKGDGEYPRSYSGHGAGGKLRSSRRSSKKATPYDRPVSGRHATAGGLPTLSDSAGSSSSLASRLVGSASRLITSSASYFFPTLFGRRTPALPRCNSAPVQEAIVEEHDNQEESEPFTDHETQSAKENITDQGPEQSLAAVGFEKTEKREFDLARVEDMLKQKSWSREQVTRLTGLLNTRLKEPPLTISRLAEARFPPSGAVANTSGLTPQRDEENLASPISEAQRWREELKRARTDCVPVEVARAYMGERTSLQSSVAQPFRATARQMDKVTELQPPPGLGLAEDRYRSFPVLRSRTRSPVPQLAKRSLLLDEEWMSVGPVRRTRHKLLHMNSSPYARALPSVDHAAIQTFTSPPVQSSQTARRILDTLEMLTPSPKSKEKITEPTDAGTSDLFSIRRRQNIHRAESFNLLSVKDTPPSNGRLKFGSPINYVGSTLATRKESHTEDKTLVSRLLSSNEGGFFSSTTSSSAATASLGYSSSAILSSTLAPTTSIQPESKPLFAFSLPPFHSEGSSTKAGLCSTAPAIVKLPEWNFSPRPSASAEAPFPILSPAREEHLGTDGFSFGPDKKSNQVDSDQRERLTSHQFGSSSLGGPFSFKMDTADSPLAAKGLPSASRQDGASRALAQSLPLLPLQATVPLSPFMSSSSSVTTTESNAPPSSAQCLFGSLPGSSPMFKASLSGQLFGGSSIAKPALVTPLTLETSGAPFTFSPPPPLVSCSTPTFSFGSSAGTINVSIEAPSSKHEAPVFNFTSPSGGSESPVVASEEISLPAPIFSFGAGAVSVPSAVAGSDSTFCFGSGASPSFGGSAAKSALFMGSGQVIGSGESTGSLPQQPFKFGGQATSGQLFGAASLSPFSSVEDSQAPSGLEAPASFSTGASGLEKSGRKFVKVKRRK